MTPGKRFLGGRLWWFLTVLVLLVIQTRIHGVKPDLVLLAVIFAAVNRGPVSAAVTGFVAGWFQDSLTSTLLGTHALCNVVVGSALGFLARYFYRERVDFQIVVTVVATVVGQALFLGLGSLTQQSLAASNIGGTLARVGLYNALLAVPTFAVMRRLTGWV